MRRCICLYHDLENSSVSLLSDRVLVSNYFGSDSLERFLNGSEIEELSLVFKPVIAKSIPKGGFRIGDFIQDNLGRVCVVSEDDIQDVLDLSKAYNISSVRVYNYLDIVGDKFKSYDSIIVLMEWLNETIGLGYYEYGVLKSFKSCAESKLGLYISRFKDQYNCQVVEDNAIYDFIEMCNEIPNLAEIPNERRTEVMHIPYVVTHEGIELVSDKEAINLNDNSINSYLENEYGISDEENEFLTNFDDEEEFNVEQEKVGFFGRLFGKKDKPSRGGYPSGRAVGQATALQYSSFEKEYSRSQDLARNDENYGTGYQFVGYKGYGDNAIAIEKSPMDIVFYAILSVVFVCMLMSFVFSHVYTNKIRSLTDASQKLETILMSKETNLNVAKSEKSKPTDVITSVVSSNFPEGTELANVSYTGEHYNVGVYSQTTFDDNSTLKNCLPGNSKVTDLDVSSTNLVKENGTSYGYLYAMTMIMS